MKSERLTVDTSGRRVVDITDRVGGFVEGIGGRGLLSVFLAHATAGLALMETGAGSEQDLETALQRVLPRDGSYAHDHGSRGHGADHLLPIFVSPSLVLPVHDGGVVLGTWQRVVIVDTNPENNAREVVLSFLES
ncbi:MAG TPA: secondary thiamine-phosphate synthase enzyme YjbQ [Actinomycetota bacterium]|nr:secondary thiamine-phosphate synthase enzyme YjbQ [Actinomycetota bacterium]